MIDNGDGNFRHPTMMKLVTSGHVNVRLRAMNQVDEKKPVADIRRAVVMRENDQLAAKKSRTRSIQDLARGL